MDALIDRLADPSPLELVLWDVQVDRKAVVLVQPTVLKFVVLMQREGFDRGPADGGVRYGFERKILPSEEGQKELAADQQGDEHPLKRRGRP